VPSLSQLSSYLHLPIPNKHLLQAQRLFHGRGHAYAGLHHITVDWLPPVVLITLYAPEPQSEIEIFADWLMTQIAPCKSVQLQHRYQLSGSVEIIRGMNIKKLCILEDSLRFHIRLGHTRNTGLFLDMRRGRRWVQEQSKNKRVLNLFAYTCRFSVAAVTGNAKSVLNIDMSSAALNVGRDNHRLNQQSLEHVRFEKLNIFKSFGRIKKRGPFDLLICDPPSFQKGSVDIARDYPKILRRVNDFMAPGGTLLLCLNALELNCDFLIKHMSALAPNYKFIKLIKPPEVFIETEGKGLKVLCFKNILDDQ
jgi:23S rRNA (cytosine1962-C5)-methyltransferase